MSASLTTCALCPRLCRPACPVTTATRREAAVPTQIAGVLLHGERGIVSLAIAADAASLCVDCGQCEVHCHISHPLPELLRGARAELLPMPAITPLSPIEGLGDIVAVEGDDRPFAAALAHRLGVPVRRWRTKDRFGVAAVEHAGWAQHGEALRRIAAGQALIVADGGVAHALDAAGVSYEWLHQKLDVSDLLGSCRVALESGPSACCGAAGPLMRAFPEDARRMGTWWLDRAPDRRYADSRCRTHLRACGQPVTDLLDELVASLP